MGSNKKLHFILERINVPDTIVLDTPEKTYMCGRAKENEIVCLSLTVSRKHCTFFFSSGELYVTDLQSSNGLFINGVLQTPYNTVKLQPNDIIGVGCSDMSVRDNTMFAYKLHRIAPSQVQESSNNDNNNVNNSNHKDNDLSQARQNINNAPVADPSNDRLDAQSKRKREKNSDEMNIVPNKIPKLNSKELEEISSGDHTATDENDIEIVHISLSSSILQQSNNNCDNNPKCAASGNKVNANEIIDTNMFEVNHGQKNQLELRKCKEVCDELVNSKEVQSLALSGANNVKKEEKLIANKSTERLNQDTCRDGLKSTESNVSYIKNKENSHNSCNIPPGSRKKDTHRKVKTAKENANPASEKSSKCSSKFFSDVNNAENGIAENFPLPPNFIQNGDTIIKLENELQLTDTDEEAIWNSNTDFTSLVSPIKLKKVHLEPKTKFSEVDIVNLSDSEDDIFPCSQLFDIGFGMDTSVKKEVKEEPCESDNGTFNALDDADLVISLSDSEDEDSTWLHRLSRSQLLNENDETSIENKDCKKEAMDVEVIDIEDPFCVLNTTEYKLQSSADVNDKMEKKQEIEKCMYEDEKEVRKEEEKEERKAEENRSFQDVRKENEMNLLCASTERMEVDSEDEDFNLMELFTSPVSNEKSISRQKQNLDLKEQRIENHVDTSDNSTIEETSTVECEPSTSSYKMKKFNKKIPEIEPPHLPTRRRSRSSTRAKEVPEKPAQKKPSVKELRKEEKIENYKYVKEQKNRRQLHKWADCIPPSKNKPSTSLTKEEKKEIADNRKKKLKDLTVGGEKRSSLEDNREKKRIPAKPIVKVSAKTRFDVLVEDTLSASRSDEITAKPGPSSARSTVTSSTSPNLKAAERKKSKDASKDITMRLQSSLTLTDLSGLGKIPKKSNVAKEKANIAAKTVSGVAVLAEAMKKGLDIGKKQTELKSAKAKSFANVEPPSCNKSNLKSSTRKPKKRVSFSTVIQTVHEYEIDESNVLKKLQGKDAPLPPTKTCRNKPRIIENTKTNVFLQRMFSWNPVWLEEQQRLGSIPPIIGQDEFNTTLTHYNSYSDYCKITIPLLLLETWSAITKEFENMKEDFRRRTFMCSIVENSIQGTMASPNIYFTSLMIEILVTKEEVQKQAYPCVKDLVFFEYVRNFEKGQSFRKVFAYVTDIYHTPLTPMTHYNKDLQNYVRNPYMLITYTMLTKSLDQKIPVNRIQRLRAVYNLTSTIRQVKALEYLPNSPIANLILYPKVDMYHLPSVSSTEPLITKDNLNPKQLEAVFKVTETIVQKQPKLCFIQGPPGTGKSKVIVNIITQVLYGNQRYTNNRRLLRILVCAPSNAAVDELTLRLLNIRSTIQGNRFRMVRIGRREVIHPNVRCISVTHLANREVEQMTVNSNSMPLDSVEEEKSLLESKINALKCEMNTPNLDENYKKHLKMKLTDTMTKYGLLENRRPLNEQNSRDLKKLQRTAETSVLAHADIITCTLASCYNPQMESVFSSNANRISVCIVDEATQSCEPETLIPLMLGVHTLVLVGDPMQLPATVLSTTAKQLGLDKSIFARVQNAFELHPNNPIIMLDTQYRMQRDIASWPNKFFYGAKLKTAVVQNKEFPFYPYRILNINANQNNENNSNTDEAQFVANMVFTMLTCSNLDKWKILLLGILTPYNDQKSVIQKEISDKMSLLPEHISKKIKFDVNTVDGFQGQERDIIIMSCVRSQRIGFLSDRQRLCVALTRARHSLILCGNFNVFMKDTMWHTLLSDARNRGVYFNVKANAEPEEIKAHIIKRTTKKR